MVIFVCRVWWSPKFVVVHRFRVQRSRLFWNPRNSEPLNPWTQNLWTLNPWVEGPIYIIVRADRNFSNEIKLRSAATSSFDVGRSMFSPRRRLYEPEAMLDLPAMHWNRCETNLTIWFINPCLHNPSHYAWQAGVHLLNQLGCGYLKIAQIKNYL